MARISAGTSFITKQAHMVTYSQEVFQGWLDIIQQLEKDIKKPSATVFWFLCGLDEDKVKRLQREIRAENIVLSKGPKDAYVIDLPEQIKNLMQDRLIQEASLAEFNNVDKESNVKIGKIWRPLTTSLMLYILDF